MAGRHTLRTGAEAWPWRWYRQGRRGGAVGSLCSAPPTQDRDHICCLHRLSSLPFLLVIGPWFSSQKLPSLVRDSGIQVGLLPSAPPHRPQIRTSGLCDPVEIWESSAETFPVIVLEGCPPFAGGLTIMMKAWSCWDHPVMGLGWGGACLRLKPA